MKNLTLTDTLEFSYEFVPKNPSDFDEHSFAFILLYSIDGSKPVQLWQSRAFENGKFVFEIEWEAVAASNVLHGTNYTLYTQKSPNDRGTRLFGDSGKFVWR